MPITSRPDGTGYPDGIAGELLTTEMAIVSACDAWDAMTNDRQYRDGMACDRAAAILRAGAGTQWRADVVEHLLAEVDATEATDTFAEVGQRVLAPAVAGGVCPDAVPVFVP